MTAKRFRPDRLQVDESRLRITWADGHVSEYPGIWLINACDCETCGSTQSAVRHRLLTSVPARPRPQSVDLDQENRIVVDWGEGHQSRFDARWLRCHCASDQERERRLPVVPAWGEAMAEQLPYFDYERVALEPALHLGFLESIHEVGFSILQNVPPERDRTEQVASLVGLLKLSNYGIYELEAKPNPEIVGDMAVPLNLHTDEPYRIDVPAITLFHVIAQSEAGGASTLADGLHLAAVLRDQSPEAFDILCRTPARFHRVLQEGRWFDNAAPIISRDHGGRITGLRLLDRGMAPVDAALEDIEPFYDALRQLLELVYRGEGMITVKLEPGEMLVFNNQRLLHGRTGFDPNAGTRHVRSCHVDLDEFHSSLRMAYQQADSDRRWGRFAASVRD